MRVVIPMLNIEYTNNYKHEFYQLSLIVKLKTSQGNHHQKIFDAKRKHFHQFDLLAYSEKIPLVFFSLRIQNILDERKD